MTKGLSSSSFLGREKSIGVSEGSLDFKEVGVDLWFSGDSLLEDWAYRELEEEGDSGGVVAFKGISLLGLPFLRLDPVFCEPLLELDEPPEGGLDGALPCGAPSIPFSNLGCGIIPL